VRLPSFADLSLSRKLTVLFTLTSGVALFVFAAALWVYQSDAYRRNLRQNMSTLAETLADSSAAALAFADDRSAAESLDVLRAEPRVASACLYRNGNVRAAAYPRKARARQCPDRPGPDRFAFSDTSFTVVQTSRLKGDDVGKLWLLVDLADYHRELRRLGGIGIGVMGLALLFAAVLSSRLQRLISGPILDLAAVAGRVSANRDYSIRARRASTDELGELVEKFNEMMEQIHQRDIALERAQSELEERVRERTSELEDEIITRRMVEQDLLNAKDAAEESNRAKSAFLANMSHELRTPLNAIIGYSELLEESDFAAADQSVSGDLRSINKAGQHLLHLINDILDLSKIEAGRMDLRSEPVLAGSIVDDVAATIQPLARKNGNEFTAHLGQNDFIVNVDMMRFRQSLLNLLSNACKFTENGKVTLNVDRRVSDGANWVCFEVRDTGPGIAPEDMNKLFRPFSQVDSSATRKHDGSGLGLAISQRFCELMGGTITVDSEPGKGSAFTIRLPEPALTEQT
jgi:signal transduction histidine kinase